MVLTDAVIAQAVADPTQRDAVPVAVVDLICKATVVVLLAGLVITCRSITLIFAPPDLADEWRRVVTDIGKAACPQATILCKGKRCGQQRKDN